MVAMLCLVATIMLWRARACFTEPLASISGVSGLDFEISTTDCWHSTETGVFVSKPGQGEKTLLFLYDSLEVPAITSVGEHAIQIALGDVDYVYCREDKWQDLTIKYDIRSVRYSGDRPYCQSGLR
ncbi:MAG: hypothetical protein ACOY4R_23310 [Pseudomonadota bacterium]